MKVAVMQPYFCPYIGYFQLISAVDTFVIYDNIQYTKKGWFNRNRYLLKGKDELFTIPVKKESDYLDVCERHLSDDSLAARKKLLAKIDGAYRRAPHYQSVMGLIEELFLYEGSNLFDYIHNSVMRLCDVFGIDTNVVISSSLTVAQGVSGEERVIETVEALGAKTYINAIGGRMLYHHDNFSARGIELLFLKPHNIVYQQFENEFVPWLSIIDVMMFNDIPRVQTYLHQYDLIM